VAGGGGRARERSSTGAEGAGLALAVVARRGVARRGAAWDPVPLRAGLRLDRDEGEAMARRKEGREETWIGGQEPPRETLSRRVPRNR
jgi:hypothetical protein